MVYAEKECLEAAESILTQAGFAVSLFCCSRPSCFDFAARKGEEQVFLRFERDIEKLSSDDSHELRAISESFSAAPLLIGEETRGKALSDDTVYTRYNVLVVTSTTLKNVVLHNTPPLIQSCPGGYYVRIDGEALKRRRHELGLSAGEVADMVGTSRRTIYGYEQGLAKASVDAAHNLIWTLGIPVARPMNILETPQTKRDYCLLTVAKSVFARCSFLNRIMRKLKRCRITTVKRAPFDFIISAPDEEVKIIGGVADEKESELDRRVEEILSISKIVQARPILIADRQESLKKNILCISSKEISRVKDPQELIASLK